MAIQVLHLLNLFRKDLNAGRKSQENKLNFRKSILLTRPKNFLKLLKISIRVLLFILLNKEPPHIPWNQYKLLIIHIQIIPFRLKTSLSLWWNIIQNATYFILEQWEYMVMEPFKDYKFQKVMLWQSLKVLKQIHGVILFR